jgi:hypothetical protein
MRRKNSGELRFTLSCGKRKPLWQLGACCSAPAEISLLYCLPLLHGRLLEDRNGVVVHGLEEVIVHSAAEIYQVRKEQSSR